MNQKYYIIEDYEDRTFYLCDAKDYSPKDKIISEFSTLFDAEIALLREINLEE